MLLPPLLWQNYWKVGSIVKWQSKSSKQLAFENKILTKFSQKMFQPSTIFLACCLRCSSETPQKSAPFLALQFTTLTATRCNTLQHAATCCDTLHHTVTHCNSLQHTATHGNTLQHTATHCNSVQYGMTPQKNSSIVFFFNMNKNRMTEERTFEHSL